MSAKLGKSGKARNSLYPLKSQGKVREFSDKSGNFSEIRRSFLRTANGIKKNKNFDSFQKFPILRGKISGKEIRES